MNKNRFKAYFTLKQTSNHYAVMVFFSMLCNTVLLMNENS